MTAARAPRPVQGETQRTGDGVGVADVDPAILPIGLDEVVRQVPRGATDEQQRQVGLQLFAGHAELRGRGVDVDALVGQQPRHHGEQPGQPGCRALLDEALTLMVGLRALAATPGVTGASGADGGEAILRALAKLEEATGEAAGVAARVRVTLDDGAAAAILADASRAVQEHRRVRLRYQSFGRDEVTERDVDPMRVISLDARWYLEGWCHRAEDVRLFRLDRVQSLAVLDADGTPPETAQPRDLAGETYQPSPDDLLVELVTEASAAWVGDYYPVDSVTDLGSGRRRVRLRVADPAWVRRLAWRLGGQVSVVAPAGVADDIARGATAALAAYPPQVVAGLGLAGMPPAPEGGG